MNKSQPHWHSLDIDQLLITFKTDLNIGLNDEQVKQGLEKFGSNRLTVKHGKSKWALLASQFNQPLVYILLISAVVTASLQEWVDAGVIFGVVLINALIGFVQEANALKAIDALSHSLNKTATVLRNGQKRLIASSELVPGDLVFLQSGDKVPADLRLLQLRNLRIDESILTGESVAVEKQLTNLAKDTVLAERSNMAFASSLVTYGTGLGIVVATGDLSEIGLINRLIASVDDLETPLTRKISQFSQWLLWIIVGCALLTFAVGVWRGETLLAMFMASVALAVGAIPDRKSVV